MIVIIFRLRRKTKIKAKLFLTLEASVLVGSNQKNASSIFSWLLLSILAQISTMITIWTEQFRDIEPNDEIKVEKKINSTNY